MTNPRVDIPYSSPPPPGSNRTLLIVLAVVGAVVALGGCVVFGLMVLLARTSRPTPAFGPPMPARVVVTTVPATRPVTPP